MKSPNSKANSRTKAIKVARSYTLVVLLSIVSGATHEFPLPLGVRGGVRQLEAPVIPTCPPGGKEGNGSGNLSGKSAHSLNLAGTLHKPTSPGRYPSGDSKGFPGFSPVFPDEDHPSLA